MSSTVNRNVAPASACAEDRISAESPPSSARNAQESPPPSARTPGQHVHVVEEMNLNSIQELKKKKESEQERSDFGTHQNEEDLSAGSAKKLSSNDSPASCGTSQLNLGKKSYQGAPSSDFDSTSDDEEGELELGTVNYEKKSVAPAPSGDRNGFPATILRDMKDFIESFKPIKFSKSDNVGCKLLMKFKKTLVCPKCEILHGHTSQGITSNQYGGTAPHKCRSSSQQLIMMLPQDIIVAIGKVYKEFSTKDASMFAAWLGSSKATRKEEILKNLNFEMQIDNQVVEYVEEEADDETMHEHLLSQINSLGGSDTYDSYSEAEFRAVISGELMALRNRIAALESENALLRQENAVLKKYRPIPTSQKPVKLPNSVTALAPVDTYLEVTKVHTPNPIILKRVKQDTVSESIYKAKIRPVVDLSLFTAGKDVDKEKTRESSKLVFVYFRGLLRRRQSEYRALFDQIGFGGYKARDICFLSEDFMQVLTYEDCVDELVTLIKKFFPDAKFVKDADPTDPVNYESHGRLSKKFLEEQYFLSMEGAVQRFKKLVIEKPFLKRTLYFLEKVVSTRDMKYQKTPEKPKVFLMNSFMPLECLVPVEAKSAPVDKAPVVSNQAPMEISQ